MKTHTKTRRGTITSSILALTLAFGLMPAQGMAFAAEAAAQAEQDAAVAQDASSDAALADAEAPAEAEAADTDTANTEVSAADPVADGAAAEPVAQQPQYTSSTEGHTAAVLPLQTEAKPAAGDIEYGGLAYTIDPENPDTAQLTGLATDKPKGDVQVQTQVASDGKVYQVTSIEIVTGGGFSANPEWR